MPFAKRLTVLLPGGRSKMAKTLATPGSNSIAFPNPFSLESRSFTSHSKENTLIDRLAKKANLFVLHKAD
jgi:hypothetical protein